VVVGILIAVVALLLLAGVVDRRNRRLGRRLRSPGEMSDMANEADRDARAMDRMHGIGGGSVPSSIDYDRVAA
jgi:hypothetical protein